jgi:hypothetical protein
MAVFSGCDVNGDSNYEFVDRQFVPVGTWGSTWEGGTDSYTIERTTLEYKNSGGDGWIGTIVAAVDFSPTSGVLIVEYTTPPTGDYSGVHGGEYKFTGVYYTGYSPTSTQFADAWLPDYSHRAEATSLNGALGLFIEGNAGTHVGQYGTYLFKVE